MTDRDHFAGMMLQTLVNASLLDMSVSKATKKLADKQQIDEVVYQSRIAIGYATILCDELKKATP